MQIEPFGAATDAKRGAKLCEGRIGNDLATYLDLFKRFAAGLSGIT